MPVHDGHHRQHGRAEKVGDRIKRLEGCIQPKRLAAKAPRMASAPRTEMACITSGYPCYLASAWYSSLGIMPHASDIRFVKLYMLAISTTSQQFFPERPKTLEAVEVFGVAVQRSFGDLDGVSRGWRCGCSSRPALRWSSVMRSARMGSPRASLRAAPWATRQYEAAVLHGDGDGDHLPLCRVQFVRGLVQLPVVVEPGGEPLGTETVGPEDVGTKPILAALRNSPAILGQLDSSGRNQLMGTPVPLREMCSTSVIGLQSLPGLLRTR